MLLLIWHGGAGFGAPALLDRCATMRSLGNGVTAARLTLDQLV